MAETVEDNKLANKKFVLNLTTFYVIKSMKKKVIFKFVELAHGKIWREDKFIKQNLIKWRGRLMN